MKAVIILAILAVAVAAPHGEDKRAFLSVITDLIHKLEAAITSAKNSFTHLVSTAGHAINFDHVLSLIVPMINSKTTQAACKTVCVTEAAALGLAVLGPILPPACDQVCHAALAQIQKLAGR